MWARNRPISAEPMDAALLQFHARLSQSATRVEEALDGLLPAGDAPLGAAMRHAVLSGGKRLRAFLAMESAALFRVPPAQALRAAAAQARTRSAKGE